MSNTETMFDISANGIFMGRFIADTAEEALDLYAQEHGYRDYADLCATCGDGAVAEECE